MPTYTVIFKKKIAIIRNSLSTVKLKSHNQSRSFACLTAFLYQQKNALSSFILKSGNNSKLNLIGNFPWIFMILVLSHFHTLK